MIFWISLRIQESILLDLDKFLAFYFLSASMILEIRHRTDKIISSKVGTPTYASGLIGSRLDTK